MFWTKVEEQMPADRTRPIRGIIAPILTPFEDDLSICQPLFDALALDLLANGCAGLAPFGTTSEALSCGVDERLEALEGLIRSGADPARMVPGTGLCNLPETVTLSRGCLDMGCAGVMMLPPFYMKGVPEDGLYAHFAEAIARIGIERPGVYLYHIPQVAGVGLPVSLVRRLKRDFPDQIVGIKDSSGDWENTRAYLDIEGLSVYPGTEMHMLDAMALGGPGSISATANLNAAAMAKVWALMDGGDEAAARAAHAADVAPARKLIQEAGFMHAQKRLMAMKTGDPRWAIVRPPLVAMPEEAGHALAAALPDGLVGA